MKRFMSQKAYLVSMVIMTVFISILSGCGGGGGGVWTPPAPSILPGAGGALAVTVVTPTAGSTVPVNTKVITASFNREMAPATLTPASFTLACNAAPITGGVVTYLAAGSLATLTLPAADLPESSPCTATITTVAKDLTGNSLAANYSWNFTTSAVLPKVFSTVPLTSTPGPTGVLTTTPITATFDKVMNPATVTAAGAFTVAGVTAAAPAVTYDIATKTATFHPLAALSPGITYTATIKGTGVSAVKDSTGNALAGNPTQPTVPNDYSWSFTTAAAPVASCNGPGPLDLGTSASFAVLAGTAFTVTNPTTINGDVGSPSITPAAGPSTIVGTMYDTSTGSLPLIATAVSNMQTAVGCANGRTCDFSYAASTDFATVGALAPGTHCVSGAMSVGSSLNLSTPGVYVFRSSGALTSANTIIVAFTGSANASNSSVFWVPTGTASIGASNTFLGTIMSSSGAITVGATSTIVPGRVLSGAAVTLNTNTVTKPTP